MGSNKDRHNPDKQQNNYGGDGDGDCPNYDTCNGREWCHDEGQVGWGEFIKWAQIDENGLLKCKGNRHNCNKLRIKWFASLSENKKKKYGEI